MLMSVYYCVYTTIVVVLLVLLVVVLLVLVVVLCVYYGKSYSLYLSCTSNGRCNSCTAGSRAAHAAMVA